MRNTVETHFCACTMGLGALLRRRYPLRLFLILLFSIHSLVRVGVLLAIEFLLALLDCARGLIAGQDLWKELKFVPSRVGVSILMRGTSSFGGGIATGPPAPSPLRAALPAGRAWKRRTPSLYGRPMSPSQSVRRAIYGRSTCARRRWGISDGYSTTT